MSCKTPKDGTLVPEQIYGNTNNSSNPLYYNSIYYTGTNETILNKFYNSTIMSQLASDYTLNLQNPYDLDTWYYQGRNEKYIPSPYNNNGSKNSIYHSQKFGSHNLNVTSDYSGFDNTKEILENTDISNQPNWKTDVEIINSYGNNYCSIACCCWRYHTEGTIQGEWYLPSLGELGYLYARLNKINESINTININFKNIGILMDPMTDYLWSSTFKSNTNSWYTYNNHDSHYLFYTFYSSRDYNQIKGSRAFLRVS